MEEELYMIGESPEVYVEMLGRPGDVGLYLRMPDLATPWEAALLLQAPQLFEGEECFLRVVGLPDSPDVWIN